MTIRKILTAPNPALRQTSKPVEKVDDALRALMDDMLETMYDAPGIGLAAIQVGVAKRVIVMDIAGEEEEPDPRFFVNPVILNPAEETKLYEEGCLSLPEFFEEVERPITCRLRYLDYDGKEQTEEAEGLFAVCIQHEIDHLEGILFVDHLSRLKRERISEKIAQRAKTRCGELERPGQCACALWEPLIFLCQYWPS